MTYKKFIFLGLMIFVLSAVFGFAADDRKEYVENRVVVQFTGDAAESFENVDLQLDRIPPKLSQNSPAARTLSRKYGSKIKTVQYHPYTGFYILETAGNCDIERLCSMLRKESFIVSASPDYYAYLCADPTIPNDPLLQYQYALHNTGQIYFPDTGLRGTSGSDTRALLSVPWTTGKEDNPITIAIIDTGVAYDHEDLQRKIVPGYNFVSDSIDASDDHGHGTFVASIAAADTNNGVGMAGVCWNARIMPIKCADRNGAASYLAIAAGIRYAADHGAKVINISIGGRNPSSILETACQYAYDRDVVIVASAGNNGSFVYFPAAYDLYCIAVAATDADDNWARFSNPGPQVDVAAPGFMILGANFDPSQPGILNEYSWDSGTSFSSPIVAGAAAAALSFKPFLEAKQVMELIKFTADDVNSATMRGVDNYLGYGRLNLFTLLSPYEPR